MYEKMDSTQISINYQTLSDAVGAVDLHRSAICTVWSSALINGCDIAFRMHPLSGSHSRKMPDFMANPRCSQRRQYIQSSGAPNKDRC
jgi:hypothetical protein